MRKCTGVGHGGGRRGKKGDFSERRVKDDEDYHYYFYYHPTYIDVPTLLRHGLYLRK